VSLGLEIEGEGDPGWTELAVGLAFQENCPFTLAVPFGGVLVKRKKSKKLDFDKTLSRVKDGVLILVMLVDEYFKHHK
jgi:hypothetical protein